MIIDFHTHCFPDKIAEAAITKLSGIAKMTPFTNGTSADTIEKIKSFGINKAVVLNIATNPSQTTNVNNFAISLLNDDFLIPLGSLNPDSDDEFIKSEALRIKNAGIKGIKIHPDYTGHFIDDREYDKIFKACSELDLFVITHAGWDFISPDLIHVTPDRILTVISRFPDLTLVVAHMGGFKLWDEVERKLIGKNIWIDTSLSPYGLDKSTAKRILENHSPDRILFGSDLPWCSGKLTLDYLESLDLENELKEKILYKNALKLLGKV